MGSISRRTLSPLLQRFFRDITPSPAFCSAVGYTSAWARMPKRSFWRKITITYCGCSHRALVGISPGTAPDLGVLVEPLALVFGRVIPSVVIARQHGALNLPVRHSAPPRAEGRLCARSMPAFVCSCRTIHHGGTEGTETATDGLGFGRVPWTRTTSTLLVFAPLPERLRGVSV